MTSAYSRLSRVPAAIALSFALAAAPALAAGYLKFGDIQGESRDDKHKGQIEILSWSWGETRATHVAGGAAGKVAMATARDSAKKGNVEYEWKVEEGESAPPPPGEAEITLKGAAKPTQPPSVTLKRGSMAAAKGEKGGTEDINIGVGELQEMTISKSMDKSTPKLAEAAIKGMVFKSPAPQGSVTTLVPAGMCKAGARYPTVELGTGEQVHMMKDVIVASCASAASSNSMPMEQISLNYARIE